MKHVPKFRRCTRNKFVKIMKEARRKGKTSITKRKYMVVRKRKRKQTNEQITNEVQEFKHLESILKHDGKCTTEI